MNVCFPSFLPNSDFKGVYFYDYLLILLELVNTHIVHFSILDDAKVSDTEGNITSHLHLGE